MARVLQVLGNEMYLQRCSRGEMFGTTSLMLGRICPPPTGWNRVKVSENLGATDIALVAPMITFLTWTRKIDLFCTLFLKGVNSGGQIGPLAHWFRYPCQLTFNNLACTYIFILSSVQYSRESQTAAEGHVLNLSRTSRDARVGKG